MAIKFRCQFCKQFLGISLGRAGQVVDCPTCGRTIRVPDLDGRVRPLPSPQLDLDDSGLVKALGEVAKIGQPPSTEEIVIDDRAVPIGRRVLEPAALSEPVAIDPPQGFAVATMQSTVALEKALHDSSVNPPGVVELGNDLITELAKLAEDAPSPVRRPVSQKNPSQRLARQLGAPAVLIAIPIAALLALGLGLFVGRAMVPPAESKAVEVNAPAKAASQEAARAAAPAANVSVRGRITFKSPSGDSSPDVGAKIVVFPIQAAGGKRISTAGLHSVATNVEVKTAQDALKKMGGALAVTDASGEFELSLPAAGTYPMLVLSKSQRRDPAKPVDAELKRLIETQFEKPESIPGEIRFYYGRVRYRGMGSEVWDYSFEGE